MAALLLACWINLRIAQRRSRHRLLAGVKAVTIVRPHQACILLGFCGMSILVSKLAINRTRLSLTTVGYRYVKPVFGASADFAFKRNVPNRLLICYSRNISQCHEE